MGNKDLIIQDLKDVIVDLKKRNEKLEFDYLVTKCISSTYIDYINNEILPLLKDHRNDFKMTIQLRDEVVNLRNKETVINNEKQFKLINDLNICQSANKRQSEIIKELQLENSEVNKLLKFRTQIIDYVFIPQCVISVIYIIVNLIK